MRTAVRLATVSLALLTAAIWNVARASPIIRIDSIPMATTTSTSEKPSRLRRVERIERILISDHLDHAGAAHPHAALVSHAVLRHQDLDGERVAGEAVGEHGDRVRGRGDVTVFQAHQLEIGALVFGRAIAARDAHQDARGARREGDGRRDAGTT